VLNRAHDFGDAAKRDLESAIGLPLAGRISNAFQDVQGAMERGKTLRQHLSRGAIVQDFEALAGEIAGADQDTERRRRAFFNFFR